MSDLAWNIWGAVAAVIGTLLAVIPIFLIWVRRRLPSKKLPGLLALLKETKKLADTALRERVITNESEIRQLDFTISTATIYVDDFRAMVYPATSFPQDMKGWWYGVSGRISSLHEQLNVVRVALVERNSRERKLRVFGKSMLPSENQGDDVSPPLSIPVLPSPYPPSTKSTYLGKAVVPGVGSSIAEITGDPRLAPFSLGRDPPLASSPTQQIISDAELHGLLSLALARAKGSKGGRPTRKEVLLHFSRQLYGLDRFPAFGGEAKRYYRRGSRFKPLAQLLRRAYGVRPLGHGGDARVDPESLLPPCPEEIDEDWLDE